MNEKTNDKLSLLLKTKEQTISYFDFSVNDDRIFMPKQYIKTKIKVK